jgi:hypothetical protein
MVMTIGEDVTKSNDDVREITERTNSLLKDNNML